MLKRLRKPFPDGTVTFKSYRELMESISLEFRNNHWAIQDLENVGYNVLKYNDEMILDKYPASTVVEFVRSHVRTKKVKYFGTTFEIPDWIAYIGIDENGTCTGFSTKPYVLGDEYRSEDSMMDLGFFKLNGYPFTKTLTAV